MLDLYGMDGSDPYISSGFPRIRQLDEAAVNRIAAGEVIERPASAVRTRRAPSMPARAGSPATSRAAARP